MVEVGSSRYVCNQCLSQRNLKFTTEILDSQTFQVLNSKNGLFLFSDIHRCENGMLGINNLHIDHNYDVRSFDHLVLPAEKKQVTSGLGLPIPKISEDGLNRIRITDHFKAGGFRISILDRGLDIFLLMGDIIPEKDEEVIMEVKSVKGTIVLQMYESVEVSEYLESWFQSLIDIMEDLPPTKIGLFVDTLKYISKLIDIPSASFHKTMLRTILSSHKISFSLMKGRYSIELERKKDVLGHDAVEQMINLLEYLKRYPETTLRQFTGIYHQDIGDLIYFFLLLQQENFLFINYAG